MKGRMSILFISRLLPLTETSPGVTSGTNRYAHRKAVRDCQVNRLTLKHQASMFQGGQRYTASNQKLVGFL